MGSSIQDLLDDLTADDLKKIVRPLGICKKKNRKADLIDCIEDFLVDETEAFLNYLTKEEKLYVAELAYNGYCDPITFSAKHKLKCPFPQGWSWKSGYTPLYLIVTDRRRNDVPHLPDELIGPLCSLLPKPPEIKIETTASIPQSIQYPDRDEERPIQIFEGERTVFQELRRIMALAQAEKITVSDKNKTPTAATVRKVSETLMLPDFQLEPPEALRRKYTDVCGPVRAYAWPVILQQTGWCKPRKGKLVLTASGKELVANMDAENYIKGIERLLENDDFDELNRINNIHGQTGKAKKYLSPPSYRKVLIFDSLSQCPFQEWVTVEEAFRTPYTGSQRYFVIENADLLYLSDRQYGHLYGHEVGIDKQYYRAFLFETLATLGLIDVAYVYPHWLWPEMGDSWGAEGYDFCGRYDGLMYVRLNPLGAYCLGELERYEIPTIEESNSLKVLPNHEIVVTGSAESFSVDRHFLELIAAPKGEYSWELDKKRILDFLETGGTIEEVRNFLQKAASNAIPNSVETFLNDIDAKTGVFGDSNEAILIELNDPSAALFIANHKLVKKYCFLAGDRRLAVIKKNLRAFRNALKKMGYVLP